MEFKDFINNECILSAIKRLGFKMPTPVQEKVYESVKTGESLFVQAPTGSGKTLAYLFPLFERYKTCGSENKVVILAPTSELALQIHRQTEELARISGIKLNSVCLNGSAGIMRQIERLKIKPQIIVGTSARILELIKKRKVAAHLVRTVVLDEGDRLFDKDNKELTDSVIKCFVRDRQLLLFSATRTKESADAAKAWCENIVDVSADAGKGLPNNIKHWYVVCEKRNKTDILRGVTGAVRTKKGLIFVNVPYDMEEINSKLSFHHYSVDYLSGSRTKDERKRAMHLFSHGKIKYLISSDLVARGLQFDDIDTVFHITMPEEANTYLHRAGRTGRAGKVGRNLSIVTKKELSLIRKYERELDIKFSEKFYYDGRLMDKPKEKK